MLPDDVLLEIFYLYLEIGCGRSWRNTWHTLVHVCCRWRYLVFASPRYLDLQLEYGGHGPISEALDAWPVLPVILVSSPGAVSSSDKQLDNLIAALESEHYNRIYEIEIEKFDMTNSRWERFAEAMQKPFPELTRLQVCTEGDVVPALPESFLGRSAPPLQTLHLESVPFPSLPTLLLSAPGLVVLTLDDIPDSGYFSPDALATALTAMTRLDYLELRFRSPRPLPHPASRPLPPPIRFALPALTELVFNGVYEYLEDLLSRIDTPLLYNLTITFFDFIGHNYDIPQLHRLISHAEEFKALDHAVVSIFHYSIIELGLYPKTVADDPPARLMLDFDCSEFGLQLSSLAQVCSSFSSLISALEELKIMEYDLPSYEMEDTQWLELLEPFTSLKNLYLMDDIARRVCGAIQELSGEMATEVLPALRNLFVDGSRSFEQIQEAIKPFVTARQLSGHPVAIHHWRR